MSQKRTSEKDLNDLLKKVKKDKDYYISMKDIILIESLRYDGINISKKYNKLYMKSRTIICQMIFKF